MAVLAFALPLCLLMLVVGTRVLVVTRRAGGTTEQLVGDAFVLLGLGGVPALFAGHDEIFAPGIEPTFFCVGQLLLAGAFSCLYLFAWRCFGPGASWRRALAILGLGGQIAGFVALGVVEGFQPPGGAVIRLVALSRLLAILWAFAESLHYWRLMKRRQGLGLVDPVVTNRFGLWSCWTGGLVVTALVVSVTRIARTSIALDFSNAVDSAIVTTVLTALTISVATLTLAFLPPPGYLRWIRRSANAA